MSAVSCKDGALLARCLSVASSKRQSLWSSFSLPVLQNQNFTTDARNKDEPGARDRIDPPPLANLETIAKAAQDIVDGQLHNKETDQENKHNDRVLEAAQDILALTCSPHRFAADLWTDDNNKMTPAGAQLHRCLVQVTSACIKAVSPELPKLLECAMDLAQRAHALSLPLHLPMYRNLCRAIAAHSRDAPAAAILEVSVWATSALCTPLDSSFFEESLLALVKTRQFQEMIDLRWSIQSRHDVDRLSPDVSMEILLEVKDVLTQTDTEQEKIEERAAATKVMNMLLPMFFEDVNDRLDAVRKKASSLATTIAAIESLLEDDDDEDSEGPEPFSSSSEDDLMSDIDSDDEIDDDEMEKQARDLLKTIASLVDKPTSEDLKTALWNVGVTPSKKEQRRPKPPPSRQMVVTVQIDQETGELQNITPSLLPPLEESDDSSQQDEEDLVSNRIARGFIYMRNSSDWEIPDVTHQLVSMNDGKKILYSQSYEDKLIQDLADEHEDMLDD